MLQKANGVFYTKNGVFPVWQYGFFVRIQNTHNINTKEDKMSDTFQF